MLRNVTILMMQLENQQATESVKDMMLVSPEQRANEILEVHLRKVHPTTQTSPVEHKSDRRYAKRLEQTLYARVWGVNSEDEPFSLECDVENISASGLFLKTSGRIGTHVNVSLVVRLLGGNRGRRSAAIVGTVMRDDPQPDGSRGIAIKITRHRFL